MPMLMIKSIKKTFLLGIIAGGTLLTGIFPAQAQLNDRSSKVEAQVTDISGTFLYEFTLFNTSDVEIGPDIVDFELPLFSLDDIDVDSILSPDGWTHEILVGKDDTSDFYNNPEGPYGDYQWNYDADTDPLLDLNQGGNPDLYGDNPQVFENPPLIIHWYSEAEDIGDGFFLPLEPISPGDSLSGFSFESEFSDQNAPYLASWFRRPPLGGDPPIPDNGFTTPNSPARQQAQMASTPESSSLFGLGMALGLGLLSINKKKTK